MNASNPLKETQKIYISIAFGLLILTAVIFYFIQSGTIAKSSEYMEILIKAVPMGIVIGLSASFYFGNKHLKKARKEKGINLKIKSYQSSVLVKNLCLAVPGILACLGALLSGEAQFLFIALAVLIVMLIAFPSKNKTISALELNENELKLFEKLVD